MSETNTVILIYGAVAQLGERVLCKHQAAGSIPVSSIFKYEKDKKAINNFFRGRAMLLLWQCPWV